MPKTLRRSRRLAATATLTCGLLLTGLAGTALASDYDGDGVATPADCKDLDPAVHPGAVDKPDLTFEDTNCDGIDGDVDKAIFVDAGAGQDTATGGTKDFPLKTIGAAITKARVAPVKDVYVTARTYAETLTLATGVGIYGGYTPFFTGRTTVTPTMVTGNPAAAVADGATGVVLQLLTLQGADQPTGGSSYGLRVVNGAKVALERVTAQGGAAVAGTAGGAGINGTSGDNGATANSGSCDAAGSGVVGGRGANNGGNGGAGGRGTGGGSSGGAGAPAGSAGTGGGAGAGHGVGAGDASGDGGGPAHAGTPGTAGTTAGATAFTLESASTGWNGANGTAGTAGTAGTGGGGGGGGGGASSVSGLYQAGGGSGGGGGAGGGGGGPGGLGAAGGGSFGVYIYNASVVARDSVLKGGAGGNGGDGGTGGTAGTAGLGRAGGSGATCGTPAAMAYGGSGGAGGAGGAGAAGGAGSGGTGGPSAAVFRSGAGSSYSALTTTETAGTPGLGGRVGGTGAQSGNGLSQARMNSLTAGTTTSDFDGDGLIDVLDNCPVVNGPVGNLGCPVRAPKLEDTDGDGVPNTADACPTTPAGANDANGDGCTDPVPAPATSVTPPSVASPQPVVTASQTERIIVTLTYFARAGAKRTKLKSLQVRNVPLGATVKVTCTGKGCPKGLKGKGYTKRNAFGAVNLKKFIKKPLRAGIRITVVVSKPNAISAVKILAIRKSKSPSITTRCIRPGTTKPVACV